MRKIVTVIAVAIVLVLLGVVFLPKLLFSAISPSLDSSSEEIGSSNVGSRSSVGEDSIRCAGIVDEEIKGYCLDGLPDREEEYVFCDDQRETLSEIYTCVALAGDDVSPCEKLEDSRARDACVKAVAERKLDASFCEDINAFDLKDGCYVGVALPRKDIVLCEKIKDSELRDYCVTTIPTL